MSKLTDVQLLQQTSGGDESQRRAALEMLVRRELDFVYAAAVRQANWDRHLAQDITQAVFILLARKAGKLRHDVILREWLFVTTRYAAKNALKIEARRRYHEQRAAAERAAAIESTEDSPPRDRLAALIDEAVSRLSSTDRAGVLLSFFDNKTYREVGQQLGVSEDAARKRVGRAIDKMRSFFASRGVTIESAAGAIAVSSALRASAGAVPPALANSVLDVALSATVVGHIAAASSSYTVAQGVSKMFIYAKLKLAAAAVAASVIVGGSGVVLFAQAAGGAGEKAPAAKEPGNPAPVPAVTDNPSGVAEFDDGMKVMCLGVSRIGANDGACWYPDGTASTNLCDPPRGTNEPPHSHQMFFRLVNCPPDAGVKWSINPKTNWSQEGALQNGALVEGGQLLTIPGNNRDFVDVTCMIATGEWESAVTAETLNGTTCGGGKHGGVIISPVVDAPNPTAGGEVGAMVTVSHDVTKCQYRLLAIDDNGGEHIAVAGNNAIASSVHQNLYHFELPVERLRTVSFQVRPYDREATFGSITLDPEKKTNVRIRVRKTPA